MIYVFLNKLSNNGKAAGAEGVITTEQLQVLIIFLMMFILSQRFLMQRRLIKNQEKIILIFSHGALL